MVSTTVKCKSMRRQSDNKSMFLKRIGLTISSLMGVSLQVVTIISAPTALCFAVPPWGEAMDNSMSMVGTRLSTSRSSVGMFSKSKSNMHELHMNRHEINMSRIKSSSELLASVRGGSSSDSVNKNSTVLMNPVNRDELNNKDSQLQKLNGESSTNTNSASGEQSVEKSVGTWPCGDDLDKQLIKIALPCIANFAINPLIGAVDLFWINRMGNPLAVAGQAAANQVFGSLFWITSFLPSVTATLVAKQYALNDKEGVQDAICQGVVVGIIMAIFGSLAILTKPEVVLSSVLTSGAPALKFAKPYLFIRGFAFLPSLISLIGFSAFRGVLDTVTPLKISLIANVFNAILDPILIFKAGMGVTGAAVATLAAEIISAILFTTVLVNRNLINLSKIFRIPSWATISPLLKGGAALQIRNFSLNLTFLAVTRVTQSIDNTGVSAAAHAMAIQTFQIGGIVLLALSTVAQIMVPNQMVPRMDALIGKKTGGKKDAKTAVNRLMSWGFILGIVLGGLQIFLLPFLQKTTPMEDVRKAALVPSYLASVYQVLNGLVFIGEGVMVGCGNFLQLSISTLVATLGTLWGLKVFSKSYGLTGVWMSFGIFNTLRFLGVWLHQFRIGPLAPKNMEKEA